jgi:DNA-binding NtrC family response regulator
VSTPGETGSLKTQALIARPDEIIFTRFRLQVTAGPEPGASCESTGEEISIGSASQNQLVVKDRAVSRHHCSITATPAGFLLRDLGSTNGTSLGGHRVEAAYLEPGSVIKVGASQIRFELLGDEVREPLSESDRYSHVLGRSAAMRRIFAVLPRIAASDSTVLIEGETGTGKGLLAEVIHKKSARARGPFVVVDCSAIPPTLIEAELFGHAKGAFTGAQSARAGAFEGAAGGTIFLDEIGELRLDMQPKLLRALEDRVIRRIGSLEPVRLDVRIVAATNRDLRREVNQSAFRADLYYRLNTVQLRVPPLRERKEDISLLASHFYAQFARDDAAEPPPSLLADLLLHPWPGNVRELRGAVERAVLFGDPTLWRESVLGAAEAPSPRGGEEAFALDPSRSFREAKELAVNRWERSFVQALIRAHGGNFSRAARAARMDRNHLRELLRRHGVSVDDD